MEVIHPVTHPGRHIWSYTPCYTPWEAYGGLYTLLYTLGGIYPGLYPVLRLVGRHIPGLYLLRRMPRGILRPVSLLANTLGPGPYTRDKPLRTGDIIDILERITTVSDSFRRKSGIRRPRVGLSPPVSLLVDVVLRVNFSTFSPFLTKRRRFPRLRACLSHRLRTVVSCLSAPFLTVLSTF